MAATNTVKRATNMPDSQGQETWRIAQAAISGYQLQAATVSANATTVSFLAFHSVVNGKWIFTAASTATFVGTVATNCTGIYVLTLGVAATISNVLAQSAASATIGTISLAAIPATNLAFGAVIVACTATGFNGGTNSLADGAYTVSFVNWSGPTGIAMTTENFTIVPG